jgi:23S rRNA pseudouridine2457 synthase
MDVGYSNFSAIFLFILHHSKFDIRHSTFIIRLLPLSFHMHPSPDRYFILNKPHGMESQFVSPYPGPLLGDIEFDFPEGTHAIGRLDKHSEGLLLLTTNKKITALLFQGKVPHKRTYLVQVKYSIAEESILRLQSGVSIRIKGGEFYMTPPCDVQIVKEPEILYPLPKPLPDHLTTSWLRITLTEGRFHQVRKMVAAVRHRCLRLLRVSIEDLLLGDLPPGKIREVDEDAFFTLLRLEERPSSNMTKQSEKPGHQLPSLDAGLYRA